MEKTFEQKLNEAQAAVKSISPQEAIKRKANDPGMVFIDPRDAQDIQSTTGIIPGAINITLNDLNEKSDDELLSKLDSHSRTIITACQGGPMGAIAAHALQKRGFNNVEFMAGGTQGWLDAGYATAR